jgi:hypothetical protein
MNDKNANWSRAGAFALAEFLEEYEESTGLELEMDVVAIRCDFSEYSSLIDWATDYFCQWRADLNINEDLEEDSDLEEIEEIIREYIEYNGQLIEFNGGIIVSSF